MPLFLFLALRLSPYFAIAQYGLFVTPGLRSAYPGLYSGALSGRSISLSLNTSFWRPISPFGLNTGFWRPISLSLNTGFCYAIAPFGAIRSAYRPISPFGLNTGSLSSRGCAPLTPGCILAPFQGALFPHCQIITSAVDRCQNYRIYFFR